MNIMVKNIRVKKGLSAVWMEMDLNDLSFFLRDPKETYQIRLSCHHPETVNQEGMTRCRFCDDLIEITSWRD